jgi:hypothetical protein
MVKAETTFTGPLFNGEAKKAVEDFQVEAEEVVADYVVSEIQNRLGKVLKHPTGYYKSKIQTNRQSDDNLVTDSNVVYGPWLEGVSSRNKDSRFKGYSTFRKVAQDLANEVGPIAEKVLPKYLRKME